MKRLNTRIDVMVDDADNLLFILPKKMTEKQMQLLAYNTEPDRSFVNGFGNTVLIYHKHKGK